MTGWDLQAVLRVQASQSTVLPRYLAAIQNITQMIQEEYDEGRN
jgi:hypothetical protein